MPSFFSTTATLQHKTPLPAGVSAPKAIELLQTYEFFLSVDPHMIKYEVTSTPDPAPIIPADRRITASDGMTSSPASSNAPSEPKCYNVTDRVAALPAGLWDSDVLSRYEFINVPRGAFVRINSPLSVAMETLWEIRENESGEGLELVEDVVVKCSRMLMSTVTGQCESGWRSIHAKMVEKLKEDA